MNSFQEQLKVKMNRYISLIYLLTKAFPKHEMYGMISQIQRAGVSILLNYVEGYARKKPLVRINFLEISYGSCQESKILINLTGELGYAKIDDLNYQESKKLINEIGAMLWSEICKFDSNH